MPFRAWVGPSAKIDVDTFPQFHQFQNGHNRLFGLLASSLKLPLRHLDMLNALLLLPSSAFRVSRLMGPFIMQPRSGKTTCETVSSRTLWLLAALCSSFWFSMLAVAAAEDRFKWIALLVFCLS